MKHIHTIFSNGKDERKALTYMGVILSLIVLSNFSFPIVQAEDFGYNYLEAGKNLNPTINYSTVEVNSSNFTDKWETNEGVLDNVSDILHNWLSNLPWSVSGHYMDTDLDMNGNDITMGNGNITEANCIELSGHTYCDFETTYYNATSITAVTGTTAGSINLTQHPDGNYDEVTFNITEQAGSPGLDIRINFTDGITEFNKGYIRYYTSTLAGEFPVIQLWDYCDDEWESGYGELIEATLDFFTIAGDVLDSSCHVSDGTVQMRLYKSSNGNTNNHYYIDMLAIVDGFATPSGNVELSNYWRKGNTEDSGNYFTSGNITANDLIINGVASIGTSIDTKNILTLSKVSSDNSNNFYGLYDTPSIDTTSTATSKAITGVFGYPVLVGNNFNAGAKSVGLDFAGGFLQAGAGSVSNLNVFGINVNGGQSFFGNGKVNKVTGIKINPTVLNFASNTQVGTGVIGMEIADSATLDNTYSPYQKQLVIARPTKATTNYQVVLEGNGVGSGIWFNGISGNRIYSDGTNLVFNTTTGIAYFTNNISAENVIDRSSYWDGDFGSALSSSYDTRLIETDNDLPEFEKVTYSVPDYDNPQVRKVEECNQVIKSGYTEQQVKYMIESGGITINDLDDYTEEECSMVDEIFYLTKEETGRDLSKVAGRVTHSLWEISKNMKLYNNLTDFDTGIMSEAIYTQSKVIDNTKNYIDKIKDKNKLDKKETHYAYVENILGSGYNGLDLEERVVVLEGAVNQLFTILCDKNILKKEDGCL